MNADDIERVNRELRHICNEPDDADPNRVPPAPSATETSSDIRRLPDEPATEAGRALLGMIHDEIDSTTFSEQEVCDHILAIEREAAAGALPSVVVDLLRDVEREFVPIYGPSESGTRVDLATAFREWLALAAPPEASER
jgi:hypothetical protein